MTIETPDGFIEHNGKRYVQIDLIKPPHELHKLQFIHENMPDQIEAGYFHLNQSEQPSPAWFEIYGGCTEYVRKDLVPKWNDNMDEAPRDGTLILLDGGTTSEDDYKKEVGSRLLTRPVVAFFQVVDFGYEIDERWVFCYWDGSWRTTYENPKRWMPLPIISGEQGDG